MFKKPDNNSDIGDDDSSSAADSFTYASDYLGDPYDYDDGGEYYYYDDDYFSSSETWSEDSFCAGVLEDYSYHFSFLFDDTSTSSSSSSSSVSFTGGFYKDTVRGHGTWTAGIAAGAISESSGVTEEDCYGNELPGCAGGCIATSDVDVLSNNGYFDLDVFCPMHDCDGYGSSYSYCLSDDPVETLHQHGGVAPGAQISVFDGSYTGFDGYMELAGNLVWLSAVDTGATVHSNSWGAGTLCQVTEDDILYDTFMYEVRHIALAWTEVYFEPKVGILVPI